MVITTSTDPLANRPNRRKAIVSSSARGGFTIAVLPASKLACLSCDLGSLVFMTLTESVHEHLDDMSLVAMCKHEVGA